MAYNRPGVTVTQVFAASAPALAAQALPCCAVGPAYQLVNDDAVGSYNGSEQAYAYAGAMPGSLVDAALLAADEEFPATKKPISLALKNVVLAILASQSTGSANGTAFTDATSGQFDDVVAGDILALTATTGVSIVAAQTNGVSTDTSGQRNRLTAGTAGQFANVNVGDSVIVTAGANTVTGTYTVTIKLSSSLLVLSANVNDGVGPSTNISYSITGNRGTAANFVVKTKVSANSLVLQSTVPGGLQAPVTYSIKRNLASTVVVDRLAAPAVTGFTADDAAATMPASYQVNGFDVLSASVFASYRALRTDLAAEVRSYANIAAIEAVFGTGQLLPSNPLGYALFVMKQNTVSAVNGLALGADFVDDELVAFVKSLDVLAMTEMYALQPLSFSPAVHSAFSTHVTQFSAPLKKKERVAVVNSRLITKELKQASQTTVTTLTSSREIVSTQVDGAGILASPAILNDATTDQFLNVAVGDTVTIVSGTGVTAGAYTVLSKQSSNQITLSANFITSGSPADIQYYIQRKDGLGANGINLYDRNATFISNGVAAGHFVVINSGSFAGRYKIGAVLSETELTLASAVLGVVTLQTAVSYKVDRDLSKDEQAEAIAGYSSSFANRRLVHTWSDNVAASVGTSVVDVPGYFASDTIVALTTGLPPQQGFTNFTVGGFLGIKHSNGYFTEDQLNTIADGGTLVFVQEGPQQPLLIRHQLTTDRSSIKFQEFSVTKNVDSIAKFMRRAYRGPSGRYNIVDTTLDYLKTVATASVKFLRDSTKVQFLGGQIRSGKLISIAEDTEQIDTVNLRFGLSVPIPLNYINITLEV